MATETIIKAIEMNFGTRESDRATPMVSNGRMQTNRRGPKAELPSHAWKLEIQSQIPIDASIESTTIARADALRSRTPKTNPTNASTNTGEYTKTPRCAENVRPNRLSALGNVNPSAPTL